MSRPQLEKEKKKKKSRLELVLSLLVLLMGACLDCALVSRIPGRVCTDRPDLLDLRNASLNQQQSILSHSQQLALPNAFGLNLAGKSKPSVWWVPCSWSKMLCGVCTEHCQTHHHQAFPFPPLAEWDQAATLIPSVPPWLQGQYLLHPCQESLQLIHLHLLLHHSLLCSSQGRACLLCFLLVL